MRTTSQHILPLLLTTATRNLAHPDSKSPRVTDSQIKQVKSHVATCRTGLTRTPKIMKRSMGVV